MKYVYSLQEIAEQRKKDNAERARIWRELYDEAGGGERGEAITSAIQELYKLYDSSVIDWSANLYDKEIGGFYPNSTARDYVGFLPDPQSTIQMFWFFGGTGLLREYNDSISNALPKWMMEKIPKFIKPLQDENGYFYNPHWSKESADFLISRRGRDLSWCTSLLKYSNSAPTYDTPNGVIGDGLLANGTAIEKKLSRSQQCTQNESTEKTASQKSTDAGDEKDAKAGAGAKSTVFPDYLMTAEHFKSYLAGLDINKSSYSVGNELNATVGQIKARDEALKAEGATWSVCDILLKWLLEHINPSTGYWASTANFSGINGFFKIIMVYNILGYPYPKEHIEAATRTVLTGLSGDEESPYNICAIYNVWSAVAFIRENIKQFTDEIRARIEGLISDLLYSELGAQAIRKTAFKLAKYKRDDGGFSHAYTTVAPSHQGLPVSTGMILAGDVDATTIGVSGISTQIFKSFGFKKVPVFMHSDWMRYLNILENLAPVRKTKLQDPLADFESGHDKRFTPFGGAVADIIFDGANHSLKATLPENGGLFVIPTARYYEGELFRFEAEIIVNSPARLSISMTEVSKKAAFMAMLDTDNQNVNLLIEGKSYPLAQVGERFTLRIDYMSAVPTKIYLSDNLLCETEPIAPVKIQAVERFEFLSAKENCVDITLDNVSFYLVKE